MTRLVTRIDLARRERCYLSLIIALVAVPCGTGCRANLPVDLAFQWLPETLRVVHALEPGFYCYAPSVIQDGNTDYVFACRNDKPGVIRDHIFAWMRNNGIAGKMTVALGPARESTAWDAFHVCDPSVVAGRFRAGKLVYRYAMFYLGNDVDASRHNQIGLALADTIDGPWTRCGGPIVPDSQPETWGTGQPSAVSMDRKGRVLLFYTIGHGSSAGYVRELDLSDALHPTIGQEVQLSMKGLTRTDGAQDRLNNFDVVLDRKRERFIMVRERHPYPSEEPRFIGAQIQVVSLPVDDLRRPDAEWTVEGEISPALTGFPRNHNAGFARTVYGELPRSHRIRIWFASSEAEPQLAGQFAAWTYALHEISAQWGGVD